MSLRDKLNRYKTHLTKVAPELVETVPANPSGPSVAASETGATGATLEIPFAEKWADLSAKPFVYDGENDEFVMVREVRYPVTRQHGKYTFAQLNEVIAAWEASDLQHPLSAAQRAAGDLLFFDTETTGLHGGAGNTIFLLGYSRIEGDAVVVRQHFLAAPHAEVALYQSFLQDIKEQKHLVTFNGKSFDWPQVKTRHTLIRNQVPQLPAFGHYDLLHGARRLWKQELESCRLSIIEQKKLGVIRTEDVPGYMAPVLYFDYLSTKDPETIQGVLYHNEIDVLSLITLYIHISKLLLAYEGESASHEEQFEIARWYEALGEDESALKGYQKVAKSGHALSGKAKIALGHLYKKQKDWEHALDIWEQSIREFAYVPQDVYIEMAKIYEHHQKDYEKALYYTLQAFDVWKRKASLLRHKSQAEQAAYQRRIERLEKKVGWRA